MDLFWQDGEQDAAVKKVPDTVVDLLLSVRCRSLPIDHAYSLYQAVSRVLPWIDAEEDFAIHSIHAAESGNGWIRPTDEDAIIYLSRRTRLIVRLPSVRINDALALENCTLEVCGNTLQLGSSKRRLLSKETILFARHIVLPGPCSEDEALQQIAAMLDECNIHAQKIMTGRGHTVRTKTQTLHCYSVMIDGINLASSVYLQQHGLGKFAKLGCGIFLPHKSISAVYKTTDAT